MQAKEFYDRYAQYARVSASKITGGAPMEVVLAFWFWETGRGTNLGTTKFNNLAGINYNRSWRNSLQLKPSPSGEYAVYSDLNNFAADYARVMNLSSYAKVRQAFKTAGYTDDVAEISASPYSVADYDRATVLGFIEEFRKLSGAPDKPKESYNVDTGIKQVIANGQASGMSNTALAALIIGAAVLLLK